ncbi:DUF2917 domain-containing protein [Pseudothauera rhizosphaerae]|nr:DUF2917 domain-containing protein [Pseudothauera rhizosphaerae]
MDTPSPTLVRQLAPRAVYLLTGAAGTELLCRSGCVWITQYGDTRDIVLQPGRSFVLDLPTAVVMTAHRGAELIQRPAPARPRRGWLARVTAWLDPRHGSGVTRELARRLPRLREAEDGGCVRPL